MTKLINELCIFCDSCRVIKLLNELYLNLLLLNFDTIIICVVFGLENTKKYLYIDTIRGYELPPIIYMLQNF